MTAQEVTETATFAQLRRIGAVSPRWKNVGENMYTPNLTDTPGEVQLWDGQISIWGQDSEVAAALADIPEGASYDEVTAALADFPNNA